MLVAYRGRLCGLAFLPCLSPLCSRRAGVRTRDCGLGRGLFFLLCVVWAWWMAAGSDESRSMVEEDGV